MSKSDDKIQNNKFTSIYDLQEINEVYSKFEYYSQNDYQDLVENLDDKTTIVLTHFTNEEFLRYLDSEFKPEINLFRHVPPKYLPTWGGGEVHDGTSRYVPPQVPPVKINSHINY